MGVEAGTVRMEWIFTKNNQPSMFLKGGVIFSTKNDVSFYSVVCVVPFFYLYVIFFLMNYHFGDDGWCLSFLFWGYLVFKSVAGTTAVPPFLLRYCGMKYK